MRKIVMMAAVVAVAFGGLAAAVAADLTGPLLRTTPPPMPAPVMVRPPVVPAPVVPDIVRFALFGGIALEGMNFGGGGFDPNTSVVRAALCTTTPTCGGGATVGPIIGNEVTSLAKLPSTRYGGTVGFDVGMNGTPFFVRLDGRLMNHGYGVAAGVGYDFGNGWRAVLSGTYDDLGKVDVTTTRTLFPGPGAIVTTQAGKARVAGFGVRALAELDAVQLGGGFAVTPQAYAGVRWLRAESSSRSRTITDPYVGVGMVVRWGN